MLSLERRHFLFVTGKGGSGKTTVTAALALALATRGRRVLVTASSAKQRISELLGGPELTTEITALRHNLWGVFLDSEVALREYGAMVLKSEKVVEALFGNKYVQGLFKGAPGLKEWSLLGKAWYHSIETLPSGARRFDTVLFDAPATGHGLDMLRVPKVILAAAPPGRLRSDAERAFSSFRDPRASGVVVVTLLEEMPLNETMELVAALRGELHLPIAEVIANSAIEPLFSDAECQLLEPFAIDESARTAVGAPNPADESAHRATGTHRPVDESARPALRAAARRALAERTQGESLRRLEAAQLSVRCLPRLTGGATNHAAALSLSRMLP
jgi:energy-coupling factor transporter ATP-binding protein EcfA2